LSAEGEPSSECSRKKRGGPALGDGRVFDGVGEVLDIDPDLWDVVDAAGFLCVRKRRLLRVDLI
jgi:hypothetical protein